MAQQGLQIYVLQLVKHGSKTSSNLQPIIYANINPVLFHRDQLVHTLRKPEHFETLVTGSTPSSLNHLQWSWPHLGSQLKLNLLSHYFSWFLLHLNSSLTAGKRGGWRTQWILSSWGEFLICFPSQPQTECSRNFYDAIPMASQRMENKTYFY